MTGLIILAAGESSRLGRPKQNLVFNGQTLLQRAVASGKESNRKKIIVVLGAHSDLITPVTGVTTLFNENWKEGMASSIRIAMVEICNNKHIDKVIIMLCDQPFVNAQLLNKLIAKQTETSKPIVACSYGDAIGVPVLFNRSLFSDLLLLRGQEGAKTILNHYAADVATVQFEQGIVDIDTNDDYESLISSGN